MARLAASNLRETLDSVAGTVSPLPKSLWMARTDRLNSASSTLVLGRYRLEETIGAGAYGTVWRARDERLDRTVAIKAIPVELGGERVEREIRAAARLSHPGVVTLHEAESDSTHTYLVAEFVRGMTLQRLYADGLASDRDIARIGAALADALDHAHSHGVIHRDIKPGNILIPDAPRSEAGVVKLADFGIAQLAGDTPLTLTGDVVGTLAYMSPEQARGEGAERESDIWALGIVLFEGFAGRNPVRGKTPAQTARTLADGEVELLGDLRPDLPPDLADAIDSALEPDPDDRCSLSELASALRDAMTELDDEPGTIAPAVRRRARGRRAQQPDTRVVRIPIETGEDLDAALTEPIATRVINQHLRIPLRSDVATAAQPGVGNLRSPSVPQQPSRDGRRAAPRWARRLVGAVTAGAITALWLDQLAPAAVNGPRWVVAVVAGAVAVLPRVGWLAAVVGAVAATAAAGFSGAALVLAAALLPVAVLMWRAPHWWSLPTLAPLLGAPGFSGAWPAFASLNSTVWLRAAAGAIGAWQIGCAQLLLNSRLVGQPQLHSAGYSAWAMSPAAALTDALIPLFHSRLVALAGIWAIAAVVLPFLVTGRSALTDAIAAAAWAAAVAVATVLLAGGLARGALAGALVGAALAVAARGLGPAASLGTEGLPPTINYRLGRTR
jgi:serine/threonine protein kinase